MCGRFSHARFGLQSAVCLSRWFFWLTGRWITHPSSSIARPSRTRSSHATRGRISTTSNLRRGEQTGLTKKRQFPSGGTWRPSPGTLWLWKRIRVHSGSHCSRRSTGQTDFGFEPRTAIGGLASSHSRGGCAHMVLSAGIASPRVRCRLLPCELSYTPRPCVGCCGRCRCGLRD